MPQQKELFLRSISNAEMYRRRHREIAIQTGIQDMVKGGPTIKRLEQSKDQESMQ